MSTQDVPGAASQNHDTLGVGNWAENDRGDTLVLVEGVEDKKVIYEIFDLSKTDDVWGYRDAMTEDRFKTYFSFPPTGTSKIRWTWHDKTEFPWSRVMKQGERPRPRPASADAELSAAERIAEDLRLRGRRIADEDIRDRQERTGRRSVREIVQNIADAISDALER